MNNFFERTVTCFENEERSCLYNIMVLKKIRQLYKDDFIVMVSAGNFSAGGEILIPSGEERSKQYVKAGADVVLSLPTASELGGYGKKEFAGAALVQRLRISDRIIIPCVPCAGQPLEGHEKHDQKDSDLKEGIASSSSALESCERSLRSYAMLMFKEEAGYRQELTQGLNEKMPLRDAQVRAVCACVPEAKTLLSYPENRHALWVLDGMLQLYYMAKVEFIEAPDFDAGREAVTFQKVTESHENEINADEPDKSIAFKIKELMEYSSPGMLIDISGSTQQIVDLVFEKKEEILKSNSFRQITQILSSAPEDAVRLFLLKAIFGIRKIYMQICGLHVYVPYSYVCAGNPDRSEILRRMEKESWVPFVRADGEGLPELENYHYLLQADEQARKLFR